MFVSHYVEYLCSDFLSYSVCVVCAVVFMLLLAILHLYSVPRYYSCVP